MKNTKLNNYLIDLFEKRLVYVGGSETVSSTGNHEPEGEEKKDDTESADTETAEKKAAEQTGPTPTAEQAKRNMTRSHAERISKRLKQLSEDDTAAGLASTIDAAYKESVQAENSHEATIIELATQKLRFALLSGRAHLETEGAYTKTGADEYAERELGLEGEGQEVLEARRKLGERSRDVRKTVDDLREKHKNLSEEQLTNIKNQLDPIYTDAMKLTKRGEFEVAKTKFNQYEEIAKGAFQKAADESKEKELSPELQARNAKKNAEGVKAGDLNDVGGGTIRTADVEFSRGNFDKAKELYEQAKNAYESVGRTAGASVESEEEIESVNVAEVMSKLQKTFMNAIQEYGAGKVDRFGSFIIEANVYNTLAATFNQLKDSEKKAIGGASIRYVTTNPRARDEAWIITATFNRSGDVSIDRQIQKREKNTELTDTERTEMGKFENGELYKLIEASEAREKTPEEVEKLLKNAIDGAVKNWAEHGTADNRILKQWIERAIDEVRKSFTPEEWQSATLETGLRIVPGTTWEWKYQVDIRNGNVLVVTK